MRTIGEMHLNNMGVYQNMIIGNQDALGAGYKTWSRPNGFSGLVFCDEQGNGIFIDFISTRRPRKDHQSGDEATNNG